MCRQSVLPQKLCTSTLLERQAREHDDAVIALLPVERDVLVAEPLEALERESVVGALGLLQAQDVGLRALMNLATRSMRSRTELMFQVVILRGMACNL